MVKIVVVRIIFRLRERLIDPLQGTYYLRTLPWGALTRQWPAQYSVWQEDANVEGGYRLIKTLDRCKYTRWLASSQTLFTRRNSYI